MSTGQGALGRCRTQKGLSTRLSLFVCLVVSLVSSLSMMKKQYQRERDRMPLS